MVDIQCPTAEIRRGNKKRRKKKPQDENHSEPEKKTWQYIFDYNFG